MFGLNDENFTACAIFSTVLLLTYYFLNLRRQYTNLPPGPAPYPFVGNLLQFVGRNYTETLRKLRNKYGNIYSVNYWGQRIVVIGGYENIKDAFVKEGSKFAYRPVMPKSLHAARGLLLTSGGIWKHNRRFTIHTLRDFGLGKNQLQCKIHEEIGFFLDAIEEHGGQPFDIEDLVQVAVSNIIGSMVFGKRFDYHDKKYLSYIHALNEMIALGEFAKPTWLRHIPGDPFRVAKVRRLIIYLHGFYMEEIEKHVTEFDISHVDDLIDAYIKQMNKHTGHDETDDMNVDILVRIVHDLFIAGTETTTTTLRFAMVFLLRHPDIQTRLSEDLQNNVPYNRLPDLSDKHNLSYLEATILEVLRRSCLLPFSIPHAVNADTNFKGYTIPKYAMVLPDLESVLMDANLWDDPQAFNPSRFLNLNMEINKKSTEYLIPFSVGPRICLGEGLAKLELYLFLSAMLQRFRFLPPDGEDPPELDCTYSTVCSPKPFMIRAIRKEDN